MQKKRLSLKNRGLVPTIQPEPDLSWTCGFPQVLHNVELIMYMKFQKTLMTGYRAIDTKHQKCPKMFFPPFVTSQDFFSKIGLYHFGTLMVPQHKTLLEKPGSKMKQAKSVIAIQIKILNFVYISGLMPMKNNNRHSNQALEWMTEIT